MLVKSPLRAASSQPARSLIQPMASPRSKNKHYLSNPATAGWLSLSSLSALLMTMHTALSCPVLDLHVLCSIYERLAMQIIQLHFSMQSQMSVTFQQLASWVATLICLNMKLSQRKSRTIERRIFHLSL